LGNDPKKRPQDARNHDAHQPAKQTPMNFHGHAFPAFSLVLGLILGSFYNVCIHRYLAGESIGNPPRSKCPKCGHTLSWWENIPLLSYAILGGRCRACKRSISPRYVVVEAVSGLLALALGLKFGPDAKWAVYMVFSGILIVAGFIDLDSYILPDFLTLPGAGLALLCAPVFLDLSVWESLSGAALGAGIFWGIQVAYLRLRGIEGMGTGDIKLMLLLGGLVGIRALPFLIFTGALSALVAGFFYMRKKDAKGMRTAVPFGPFLSLGAMLSILVGDGVMLWFAGV